MFSSYIILSLTFLCVITYGYCTRKWFKLWWPDQSYSAQALFLGNALMFIFASLAFAQSIHHVINGQDYSPFTLALITVIFIHALIQLALAQGYFARKE